MRPLRQVLAAALLAGAWSVAPAQTLDDARAQAERRDYAGARATLERRLAQVPDDDAARFLLARVLAWQGTPEAALPLYRDLLDREPGNADYLLGLGQAQLWSGRRSEAVATLERARQLAPGYVDVAAALEQARAATRPDAGQAVAGSAAPAATPAVAPVPGAGPAATPRRAIALSARLDRLDRGLDDWRAVRLDAVATAPGRPGVSGALVSEQRFGLTDRGVELGAVLPLGTDWSLQPQLGVVSGAEFLPRRFIDLRLERRFGGGWVGAAGMRRSDYREVRVERLALGIERYVGAWRAGYTANLTRIDGGSALGHDLRIARGYGERSEIGAQLALGREDALLGTQVVTSDVRAFSVHGRHAFAPAWSLLWNVGSVRQGDLYTRRGLTLGVERRF